MSSSSSLFILLPHHYSTTHLLSKPFSSSKTLTLNLDPLKSNTLLHYGPSLSKGLNPNPNSGGRDFIERSAFSRAFDVAALRVPASECSSLERRLPGDDLDPDIKNILRDPSFDGSDRLDGKSDDSEEALSPVLYREKLAKEFNCRGFVKFRNLAKISRPKKKRKGVGVVEREKESCYKFEVIESGGREGEEMKGLLGDEFGGSGRWRGPTRLLLLDEGYAKRGAEELPEAIKAVLLGDALQSRRSISELVQCQLTLNYNYWQMNELLEALLPEGMLIPMGFETVGHIAHLNLRDELTLQETNCSVTGSLELTACNRKTKACLLLF